MKKKQKAEKEKSKDQVKQEARREYKSPPTFDEIRDRLGINDGPIGNTD